MANDVRAEIGRAALFSIERAVQGANLCQWLPSGWPNARPSAPTVWAALIESPQYQPASVIERSQLTGFGLPAYASSDFATTSRCTGALPRFASPANARR
jgi:hypothetical protein